MTKRDWHAIEGFIGFLMCMIGIFGSNIMPPNPEQLNLAFLHPYVGGLMTAFGFAMTIDGIMRYHE